MKAFAIGLGLFVALFAAGCARKEAQTPQDLQQAFGGANALKSAPPEIQTMVNQAVTAMEAKDEMTAVMSLRSLRDNTQISAEQVMVVEDLMGKAHRNLFERAEKGDPQAMAALQALRMNPR